MVEGGGTVHAQFLAAGLADELHLVVAPFFVGDGRAPRFVGEGRFPGTRVAAPVWPRPARSATWSCSDALSTPPTNPAARPTDPPAPTGPNVEHGVGG